MKTNSIYYWILFSTFLLFACNKKDVVKKEDYKEFKDWLSINGQAYKEGTLNKIGADGKIQQLNLDWSNTSSYKIDGIDYTEVRFVNSNSGNDDLKSATNIFNNSESDDDFFSLVFRNRFGKIEGAVKWTDENSTFKQEGKEEQGSLEFYHDFNNNIINAWLYEINSRKLRVLSKVVNDINNPQSLSTTKVLGGGCSSIFVQSKHYHCTGDPFLNPNGGTNYNVSCGWVSGGFVEFKSCSGGGGPGSAIGGGGGGGGSNGNSVWPSLKAPAKEEPKNPCPLSLEELKAAIPGNSTQSIALGKLIELLEKWGPKFGFDNEYKIRHFLAQIASETGGIYTLRKVEGVNYGVPGLLITFGSFFSNNPANWGHGFANPADYARQPQKTANYVWAYANGNNGGNDGWNFRGRGPIQISGRRIYTDFQAFYNRLFPDRQLDFINNPDLINSTDEIATLASMFWCKQNLWNRFKTWDQNTSAKEVSGIVNRGSKTKEASHEQERLDYFDAINKHIDCDN
jgi:putative chitinase